MQELERKDQAKSSPVQKFSDHEETFHKVRNDPDPEECSKGHQNLNQVDK